MLVVVDPREDRSWLQAKNTPHHLLSLWSACIQHVAETPHEHLRRTLADQGYHGEDCSLCRVRILNPMMVFEKGSCRGPPSEALQHV